jgi:hypothetical protein
MVSPRLIVRADATAVTGAGHAMRCLGLLEAWRERGGEGALWGTVSLPFVDARAREGGIPVVQAPAAADVLVVDLYDPAAREALANASVARVRVLVDDLGEAIPRGYDAVWNPNPYGHPGLYPDVAATLLVGTDTVAIRTGLPRWIGDQSGAISLGGRSLSPWQRNLMTDILDRSGISGLMAVGEEVPDGFRRVGGHRLWDQLRHAEWLISTASTTLWEAATVGIPVVALIVEDNQRLVGEWVAARGVPTLDLRGRPCTGETANAIVKELPAAASLPPLASGVDNVVTWLRSLVG